MTRERRQEPWWRVMAIFDPDGTGSDFGYTVGLATQGVPELHLWSRPALGQDPGLDWKFSQSDTCRLLNELAWCLLDGELQVGDTWERAYDEGLVTARFEVHEPVAAEEVDAFHAEGSLVLPVRWELVREPVGEPTPMTEDAQTRAAAELAALLPTLPSGTAAPQDWPLPTTSTWCVDQRFGPRTPLVLARAAQVWGAEGDDLIAIVSHGLVLQGRWSPSYATAVALAAARPVGRVEALQRLEEAARALCAGFGEVWGVEECRALRAWFLDGIEDHPQAEPAWQGARASLTELVTALLVVEAAADLLAPDMVTRGQGPVLAAVCGTVLAPEERYQCAPLVAAEVRRVFADASDEALVQAALDWQTQQGTEPELELETIRLLEATHAPPLPELLGADRAPSVAFLLTLRREQGSVLQQWANALAAILTERARLHADTVDAFAATGRHIPGLARRVNEPLVLADR